MLYNIRSATLQDVDDIRALMRVSMFEMGKGYYTNAELESYLSNLPQKVRYPILFSDRICIVATCKKQIIGFTQYDPSKSSVDAIYVLPKHTGNGLGSRMLAYIEDVARSLKKQEINAGISMNALRFYQKSQYIFKKTYYRTCKDGTRFASAEVNKQLNNTLV